MFTVHLDESYGTANAYSVAGYVATVEQWGELEREFQELAAQEDYKVLHKVDLEHFKDEFEWLYLSQDEKVARRTRINRRACGIILRRVRAGFGVSVVKSNWAEVDKGKWAAIIGESFYAAGTFGCMALISKWADYFQVNDSIWYVFERGAEGRDETEKMLRRIENNPESRSLFRMSGWSFESKKDETTRKGTFYSAVIPLQSADFLAYEVYRHMDNQVLGGRKFDSQGNPIWTRRALRCLIQNTPEYARYVELPTNKKPTPHYLRWLNKADLLGLLETLEAAFGADARIIW